MADINLLPEDLRDKETKAREQAQADAGTLGFSKPQEKAELPAEGQAPGRWQQLMSALKKNMNASSTPLAKNTSVPTPTAPPAKPIPPSEPPAVSVSSVAKATAPVVKMPAAEPKPPARVTPMPAGPKSPVQPPTILDVNLIPAQEGKQISSQQVVILGGALTAAVILVLGVYFGLRYYVSQKESENQTIQQEVIALQQQLESARAEAEAALAIQGRIAILSNELNEQSHWQEFFKFLEGNTIPTVVLNNLAADANGTVSISGQAPSLAEVGRQMLAFEQHKQVISVTLGDVGLETSRDRTGVQASYIRFNMSLKVEPQLFITTLSASQ